MRVFLVLAAVLVAVSCEEKFTNRYDNVDLENILQNDRLLKNYVYCLLDKGRCTTDASELKRSWYFVMSPLASSTASNLLGMDSIRFCE
ncbi:hypothetical protein NQ317_013245 [Molorchus minor]|uniref:Uncharacterized protein n=1 Tax=Molorchus minor TaxID=1323400 RepID=A0ABQ9JYI2_9CUCU|nr:hypothetical protein NQ317_013245 [Molorchus minor]